MFPLGGRALEGSHWANARSTYQTPNTGVCSEAVRLWGLSSMVARGKAQTVV